MANPSRPAIQTFPFDRSTITLKETAKGHFYMVGDVRIPSVNTYLDIISYPQLREWELRTERGFVVDVATELYDHTKMVKPYSPYAFRLVLNRRIDQVRLARVIDPRTEIGSRIHGAIEALCRQKMGEDVVLPEPPPDDHYFRSRYDAAISGFLRWTEEVGFVPLEVEAPVVHLPLFYAGRYDCKAMVRESIALLDWKSGRTIYRRHHVQLNAYRNAELWMRQHPLPDQQIILKLPSVEGEEAQEVPVANNQRLMDELMAAKICYEGVYGQPPVQTTEGEANEQTEVQSANL